MHALLFFAPFHLLVFFCFSFLFLLFPFSSIGFFIFFFCILFFFCSLSRSDSFPCLFYFLLFLFFFCFSFFVFTDRFILYLYLLPLFYRQTIIFYILSLCYPSSFSLPSRSLSLSLSLLYFVSTDRLALWILLLSSYTPTVLIFSPFLCHSSFSLSCVLSADRLIVRLLSLLPSTRYLFLRSLLSLVTLPFHFSLYVSSLVIGLHCGFIPSFLLLLLQTTHSYLLFSFPSVRFTSLP